MKKTALLTLCLMAALTQASAQSSEEAQQRYTSHSVLSEGKWVKIKVEDSGIYQLTEQWVREAGFSDLSSIRVYGYGGALQPEKLTADYLSATDDLPEVPTCTVGGRRLFYAQGPVSWESATDIRRTRNNYSNYGYYFITETDGQATTLSADDFAAAVYPSPNEYHSIYEVDDYAWFKGGRNLYDAQLLGIDVPRHYLLGASSPSGTLTVCMSYSDTCNATVAVNGTTVGRILVNETTIKGVEQRSFTDEYSSAAADVWFFHTDDLLTDTTVVTITQTSGNDMRLDYISLRCDNPRPLPDLETTAFPEPVLVGPVENQDRHADEAADMIIIIPTSQQFLGQAERLKQLHEQHDNMRVRIIRADELYNEFSSGTPDANAYRRYLKMLYDRAELELDRPRYLLLFGDCAWDNRMVLSDWSTCTPDDFLLCFESENSFSETECFVTDDYFCMLDDDEGGGDIKRDVTEVAVGRLPARTEAEAKIMVDKITGYVNNEHPGPWQNTICMMGDDGNKNQHMRDAETVSKQIEEYDDAFLVRKVYWDAYERHKSSIGNTYPDVSRLIKQYMREGALIMNYSGHGSPYYLSHERVVFREDFAEPSDDHLALWFTASCDNMPFDTQEPNIGEVAMLNPHGGAIAFYGTPRTVYATYNVAMNKSFMKYVLGWKNGERISIGEAARMAKNDQLFDSRGNKLRDTPSNRKPIVNRLQFVLLGDPAIVLPVPIMRAVIDSINGRDVTEDELRLVAGSQVYVKGHIESNGMFTDGTASLTVCDAEQTIRCRLNKQSDNEMPTSAMVYNDHPDILYVGTDSVRGGTFTFSFVVPKDISYSDDPGMFIVHAVSSDGTISAHGRDESFSMGGYDATGDDGAGPAIYSYLDDQSFTDGSTVGAQPTFHAIIYDENGINAAGSGIGHDMELIVDAASRTTYNLNSYFEYDFGDYRRGTVSYRLPPLSNGRHQLLFRVWDVFNNSSTALLNFVVDKDYQPSGISDVRLSSPFGHADIFDAAGRSVNGTHAKGGLYIFRTPEGTVKKKIVTRQ